MSKKTTDLSEREKYALERLESIYQGKASALVKKYKTPAVMMCRIIDQIPLIIEGEVEMWPKKRLLEDTRLHSDYGGSINLRYIFDFTAFEKEEVFREDEHKAAQDLLYMEYLDVKDSIYLDENCDPLKIVQAFENYGE